MQSNVSLLGMPAQCMHLSLQHIKPSSSIQAQTWFQLMTHVPLSKALGNCAVEKGITQLKPFSMAAPLCLEAKSYRFEKYRSDLNFVYFWVTPPKDLPKSSFRGIYVEKTRISPIHFPYNFDNHLKSLMLHTVKRDIFRDAYIQTVKKLPLFLGI